MTEDLGIPEWFDNICHPSQYETAARWYRFFSNQGFEAEILSNRHGAVLRLNGDHPLVVAPCFDVYNVVRSKGQFGEADVDDPYGRLQVLQSLARDGIIDSEADLLIVGDKSLFFNWSGSPAILGVMRNNDGWSNSEWEEAEIFRCHFCKKIAIKSVFGSYEGRPCGHHDGDHYIETLEFEELKHMENQWSWTSHVDRNFKRNGPEKYDLYRVYSEKDLLYVGQSNDWPRRMGEHKRSSSWLDQATQITITRYESKAELNYAEKLAIRSEGPLFNIVHNR